MNVGITGKSGFVGGHLENRLAREEDINVLPFEDSYYDDESKLIDFAQKADVIVHLAGVNRDEPDVIFNKNIELMQKLLDAADSSGSKPKILFSSTTQIEKDNPYGKGKLAAMQILEKWCGDRDAAGVSMVVPNVFGDGGKPFYNSVVATFCHQVAYGEQPEIKVDGQLSMIHINYLVEDICGLIRENTSGCRVEHIKPRVEGVRVSKILDLLYSFQKCYSDGFVPSFSSDFERDLYNTFVTYMDSNDWQKNLKSSRDDRGSFVEVYKFEEAGQVSFSTTKPGITRGNHYHTRKSEKFCVVSGQASIKLRRIGTQEVIEYKVSGDEPSWVEMPVNYTHNITNTGNSQLVTIFWISEPFDPKDPDTFYEEV
ncbi:NAD dependent epimerase/dehydratase family protein [Sedimentisphaera cyanobacteriorum]|uniref:NAD dependent epimerase/dehydratase family protein n=1 Tax=Sedimentisphaera cyanobacteriorum TaxID=1940790 RepID=A0A1Q2HPJ5_9BACT|nr:NAD-dependent epimerase/dehydratase family protein [Sedimentisphaera cyanobacteriorum]AQQ09153.1 NAD dependent epimerase/dehydratase family protein [Sedimentisphaera cyanobacteriorum]